MKLQSLENKLTATMKHAEEVMNELTTTFELMNEYIETAKIKQEIADVLNEMSEEEKDKLLIDIIANMYKDAINQAKAKQAFQKFLMWTNAQ